MQEEIYKRMYEVEGAHWWFAGKRRIIYDLLSRYVRRPDGSATSDSTAGSLAAGGSLAASGSGLSGLAAGGSLAASGAVRVADLGCGCGKMLEELPEGFSGVGLDASATAAAFCRERGVTAVVGALPGNVPFAEGSFDAVILADILEHVEDDASAAAAAARLLRPGGVMIVTVPAFPALWSSWDEMHGHKRRYTAKRLKAALGGAGLHIELVSYYNTFLFPAAVAGRLAKKITGARSAAELSIPPAWLNAVLAAIFASERHLLGRVPLPVGLSLVAVLRRP
jgi:SAM-dependent methyltransferase